MSYSDSIKQIADELTVREGSILIPGATGLIGSCITDTLLEANRKGAHFNIFVMSRQSHQFKKGVFPIVQNICEPLDIDYNFDYIINCASIADPQNYVMEPVETILTNISGNKNLLEYCRTHSKTRMLMTSTFEVYGHIEGVSSYKEDMSGVIDQTMLRNVYPESKRSSELLVKSYVNEYNVDAVIARLPSVYGPTMRMSDSKAHAQFIKNAIFGENIIIKSEGKQRRSYLYVIDAVSGIFKVLFSGEKGAIYNISNENSIASISDVAYQCAQIANTKVCFVAPDNSESRAYSKPADCILDNSKIKSLGWQAKYSLEKGLAETINLLRDLIKSENY